MHYPPVVHVRPCRRSLAENPEALFERVSFDTMVNTHSMVERDFGVLSVPIPRPCDEDSLCAGGNRHFEHSQLV